jgi:hypothetical protein
MVFESFHEFNAWKGCKGTKIVVECSLMVDVSVCSGMLTMAVVHGGKSNYPKK